MKRKARVMLTQTCPRDCDECCNKYSTTIESLETLKDRAALLNFDEIMLTGGEPMLYPGYVLEVATWLKNNGKKVYLYTTMWAYWLGEELLDVLDGVHYTCHHPFSGDDPHNLHDFFEDIRGRDGSYRLTLDPAIDKPVSLEPASLSQIKVLEWIKDCPLPEEKLYLLEETCYYSGR